MKLISTNKGFKTTFLRLIAQYSNISFGVAWASSGTEVFAALITHRSKIRSAVIGTHFYQTHPDVLDEFVGSDSVRFVVQPTGVFHPKVYLFWDKHSWAVLIGSANLTAGAFKVNTELTTLITSADTNSSFKDEVLELIAGYTADARTINLDEAANYRRIWELKRPELDCLADQYGGREAGKPAIDSTVMSMDWATYFARIQQDPIHGFNQRISLLKTVRKAFEKHAHFNDMDVQIRRGIAGVKSSFLPNSEWFGSMTGAGVFRSLVLQGAPGLSLALDKIPLEGAVSRADYDGFVEEYVKAFANGRHGIGTATRLLAMKRPDTFLCVDSANRAKLAEDVGIPRPDQIDYARYWDEVVLRLMAAPWWSAPKPEDPDELEAWKGRAAMLDAIFYVQR
ncbi:hypothetical protein AU074_08905 [Pseudomonas sp. ATCC PTA-122608]|jgi:HKD family nuclease|uniref:phospholipase D family protein n=1 Tax=Pseudomonas sp. ATCC PTA-122608 TaxID=1771311 RepID=UPI00096BCABC|nr:phospholipase D family protein [Pseudomonas sp. ATCC PTA-122608]OLY72822.1 hypothetical protein AU074_08905 [Pseudomonas sp. ATCC PTA-122608]